jgi:fructose-1-phosphate kinase PfkB-like protein
MIAREEKMDTEETIRFSTACAWEDSLHVEKGFRDRSEIDRLVPQVNIEKLD